MKRTIPWLSFESGRERKKKDAIFYKLMFPFGEEQREKELKLLRALIPPESGLGDTDLMYHLLCVKECLLEEDEEERKEEFNYWMSLPLTKTLSEYDIKIFIALAALEKDLKTLDDFPDTETLEKTAGV